MVALFEKLEIQRIQFQQGDHEVVVNCKITQNQEVIETVLWITFSDLNRILSRLNNAGVEIDSTRFTIIEMGAETLYECDSRSFGLDSFILEELSFHNPIRQIRA